MESRQALVPRSAAPSEKEWDQWRDFILEEYLIKDRKLDEVLKSLMQLNPQITMSQFRAKLRQWNIHKTLSAKEWRYVNHSIQKRTSQNKDSVVILSGMRLTSEKVVSRTSHHRPVTLLDKWKPPPSPSPPPATIPLYICTPRTTSPGPVSSRIWSKNLPWLQFAETTLLELTSDLQLLPPSEADVAVSTSASKTTRPRKRRRLNNASLVWPSLETLVRRSMEIIIGSNELANTLLLTKSVDRIAGRLDGVLPDNSPGGNLRRAIALSNGSRSEVLGEVLKILLFLTSNHMIMDHLVLFDPDSLDVYIQEARALVDVFCFSGLAEPIMLARIVAISIESPTITAVLDLLFKAAVVTESVDLVVGLLAADDRISLQQEVFESYSVVEFAALSDSPTFLHRLLQAGGDINQTDPARDSLLTLATLGVPDDVSIQVVQMLLENGAIIRRDEHQVALHAAVCRGNFQLIDLLHTAGLDFTSIGSIIDIKYNPIKLLWCDDIRKKYVEENLVNATCLELAASFSSKNSHQQDLHWFDKDVDEETSLNLVKYIIAKAGPEFDIDGTLKSKAMIFAAMYGYTTVISYLFQNGGRVDIINGFMCPVYAAVNWAQVEACRLLLQLGGLARAQYRQVPDIEGVLHSAQLSPLHVAVGYNSSELVNVLVQSGVDINLPCEIYDAPTYVGLGFFQQSSFEDFGKFETFIGEILSPLHLVMALGFSEISLLLINSGAIFGNDDLFQAASSGQYQLVSRLLELGAIPNAAVRDNQTALEASIYNGHESVTIRLLEFGARIEHNTLSLALRYGRHQTVMKLMNVDSSLTGQELVWAFRIPNELMLRSFLRSRPCGISASERSPDGRSPLENAILSFDIAVIKFTLSLNTLAYDSGALCAAVLAAAQSSVAGMDDILREMLRRREFVCHEHSDFDQTLENTAVSIAAYYERIDIILQLHGREGRTIGFAVLPELSLWKWPEQFESLKVSYRPIRFTPKYDNPDISVLSFDCCRVSLHEWSNWHDGDRRLVSPVFLAVKSQSESVVEALLEQGYRADGHSLKAAIFENFSLGLLKRLAEECTDINSSETIDMIHPYTPVLLVNFFQNPDLVEILLDAGADLNFGPWQVRAHVLRRLIVSGRSELLDVLLQHDIKINDIPSVRAVGDTPLQTAAAMGNLGIMRRLLEKGADPNAKRAVYLGSTAIEAAVKHGRLDATQLLLDYGVDTEGPGRFSYVLATYQARRRGFLAIVNILKSHRRWTDDDERMMREIEPTYTHGETFLHKSEYSEDEIEELITCIHDLRTRPSGDLIVLLGVEEAMENSCEEIENRSEETDTAVTPLESPHISSGPIMAVNQEDGNDTLTIFMDAENSHGEALRPILYRETLSPDEFGFADAVFTEVVNDTQEVSNVLVTSFDITEEQTENTQLWQCDEAGESSQRYQQVRDDILGEREAPFEPIEWIL